MNDKQTNELRLRGGQTILGYLKNFSATEKVIFGIFSITLIITAITMALSANALFMKEVPTHGGTLHEGLVGLPHTINPVLAITDVDRDISSIVYAGLTKYHNNKIVPDLASSWKVSPDGLTYTFELKPRLTFQNDMPLTASDIVFTIEKIKDPALKSPRASDWTGVQATTTSPTTVVFNLRQPYSSFLSNTTVGILPMKIWGNVTNDQFIFSEYNTKPIGAGPYKISSIDRDQGGIPTNYHLESWSGYNGKEPYIAKINFTFFPDIDHALKAIDNNSIDSLSSIPPTAATKLASNKSEPYSVVSTPLMRTFGVFWNQNKNTLLANHEIRKALDMATDRTYIIDNVLNGYAVPIFDVLPLGLEIATTTTPRKADLVGAAAILAKDGWKLGPDGILGKKASKKAATTTLSFTLFTADTPDLRQVSELLKTNWKSIGVNVTLKILEPTDLYQNVIRTRDYDALLFGEAVFKTNDLYAFWHSSQRNSPGLNIAMYTNSKADRLLETLRNATSSEESNQSYKTFRNIIADDSPATFLYSPNLIYVIPKKLRGINLSISSGPFDRFSGISDWYIETENIWKIFAKN